MEFVSNLYKSLGFFFSHFHEKGILLRNYEKEILLRGKLVFLPQIFRVGFFFSLGFLFLKEAELPPLLPPKMNTR